MNENSCRICFKSDFEKSFSLEIINEKLDLSYAKIYEFVCGFEPLNDPKILCLICADTLSTAFRFKQRLEENEIFLRTHHIKSGNGDEPEIEIPIVLKPKTELIVFENDVVKEEEDDFIETLSNHSNFEENINDDDEKCKKSKKSEKIQCPLCSFEGRGKNIFRKHVKRAHNNQRLKCDGCLETFHLIYVLLEHRKEKHKFGHEYKVDVACDESDDKTLSKGKKCPYCDHFCSSYKILREHCNTSHPDKKYGCPDCDERFPLAYHLRKHRRLVHNYQPENVTTICGYCGKFFPQKSLDSHIKNIHFKPDTEYTCDKCNIKITTKPGLINHMRSRHMNVVYNCRHCEESFPNYSCRRTHEVRFHTFDYKFVCNFCPKKFMERVQLRKHIATHTGERRYRCEICAMAFITLTNLKLHLASHSDARPFICQICNSAFKTKMALRKHHRTHEERQQFRVNWRLHKHEHTAHQKLTGRQKVYHQKIHQTDDTAETDVVDKNVYVAEIVVEPEHPSEHSLENTVDQNGCGNVAFVKSEHRTENAVNIVPEKAVASEIIGVIAQNEINKKVKLQETVENVEPDSDSVNNPVKNRTKSKVFCPVCNNSVTRKASLKRHFRLLHNFNQKLNAEQHNLLDEVWKRNVNYVK